MTSALRPFDGFELRVVAEADLPLLARGHADPEVYRWWEGRPLSEDEVRARYVENDEPITCGLVHLEGSPLGYLQFFRYEVAAWRTADRDRGLGTRLVTGALRRVAEERGAALILIDPLLDNPRAIACYRRAGFLPRRVLPAHDEQAGVRKDALLMARRPPGGGRLAEAGG